MDLTQTLVAAAKADRNAAQALEDYQARNYAEFVNAMAAEVATEGKDPMARQLAGIYLKNVLYAKNETVQVQKHEAWKAQSVETRQGVKQNLLVAMRSPEEAARKSAATAAAEVAAIEVPFEAWPEFLPNMLENVTAEAHPPEIKVAALTCLGYTCERMAELDNVPEIATTTTDAMLTTIVDGLLPSRPDIVRLAATTALSNSLLFTHSNMERKEERDAIMSNICEATTCADARVRKQAFNCINTVAYHYYEKLPEYMVALFEITTKTISSDQEEVATEAIEFWSVIAETEDEMQENEQASQRYAHQAVGPLVPLLLEAMTKQDEHADLDMDQFGLSMAAGTCLGNLSMTVADDITAAVLPFVQENIQNENWHFREAATMAFACVLEGVTPESIAAIVHQSIPVLMGALNDPVDLVKDTTLYTISKICENHSLAIPGDVLPTLVNGLISKLPTEPPQVAKQASNALHKLGMAFDGNPLGDQIGSNQLSPFLPDLLQQLMAAADRPDANECGLRVACFEAINVFIQNAAPDCKPLLLQLFPALVDRLGASFGLPASEARDGLQGLLCSSLQVMCQSLDVADIVPHADKLMTHFLQVLQVKSSSAQVEALSAISAMADALGPEFEKYMPALQPYLLAGLRLFEAFEVCRVSVGIVGDLTRSLEIKIQPYTRDIMDVLVASLKDPSLDRSVKPIVLSCFGEIAMALNEHFEPYVQACLMLLMQASGMEAPQDDDDMIDYINELRGSVLEAYTGIVTGLNDGNRLDLLSSYLPALVQFLQRIAADPNRDAAIIKSAAGLIGDIAKPYGKQIKEQIHQPFIGQLLNEAAQARDPDTVAIANWAMSEVQNIIQ